MINTFVILNAVFSGLHLLFFLWTAFNLFVGLSGGFEEQMATYNTESERSIFMASAIGGGSFGILVNLLIFLLGMMAAIGLHKRTKWGYNLHLATAGLLSLSCCLCCLGIGYTIPAFIFAGKPEFKAEFPDLEGG